MIEASSIPPSWQRARDCSGPARVRWSPIASDARLDALRDVAVAAWNGDGRIAAKDRGAFLAVGFSEGQLSDLLASASAPLASRRSVLEA